MQQYSYPGLFLILVACSFGFPFSKTVLLVAGGVLASQGIGNLYAFVLIGTAGLVTGDGVYYLLGYTGGERVLRWRVFSRRRFTQALQEADSRHRRQGWWAVFAARFIPYVRAVVFLAAGLSRMAPSRFFLADGLSALLYAAAFCLCGYLFSENWDVLYGYAVEHRGTLAAVVLGAGAALLFAWAAWKRNRCKGEMSPGSRAR